MVRSQQRAGNYGDPFSDIVRFICHVILPVEDYTN